MPSPGDLSQLALCAHTPTRCARTHAFTLVFTRACQTGPGSLHPISHSGGEELWTPEGMGGCRSQDRPYGSPDPCCPAPLGSQVSNTWDGPIGSQTCRLPVHSPDLIPHLRRPHTCQIQESSEPREVSLHLRGHQEIPGNRGCCQPGPMCSVLCGFLFFKKEKHREMQLPIELYGGLEMSGVLSEKIRI